MPTLRSFVVPSAALLLLALLAAPAPGPAAPQARLASNDIAAAPSPEVLVPNVVFYYQSHSLSCEEAAASMALTHQGIVLDQEEILRAIGADKTAMHFDPNGRMRWGDPYRSFVGSVDGLEFEDTGYGASYPPLVALARRHGARILAAGPMDVSTVYAYLWSAHPVVVWATWRGGISATTTSRLTGAGFPGSVRTTLTSTPPSASGPAPCS